MLPFRFGSDFVIHVVNPFLTGPELTSAETCHPIIRYSILRVYYYMNLFMLFSTALNIMFYTTYIDANLLMGRKP